MTHTYSTDDVYFVTLTVTDAANATDSSLSVAVIEPASAPPTQPPVVPVPPALWLFGSALGVLAWRGSGVKRDNQTHSAGMEKPGDTPGFFLSIRTYESLHRL